MEIAWKKIFCALLVSGAFTSSSFGMLSGTTPTAPGDTVVPGLTSQLPGTLLASLVAPFSMDTGFSRPTAGTLTSAVIQETGGTLDFYYQINNFGTSETDIIRETNINFTGYLTNTGYRTDGAGGAFATGSFAPTSADRSADGSLIGFDFQGIPDGFDSNIVLICTNATSFTAGSAAVFDDGTGPNGAVSQTVAAFQPFPSIPEPASLSLLAIGSIAILARRRQIRPATARY
jgi:hypothetical protein